MIQIEKKRRFVELCLSYYTHRNCFLVDREGERVPITFFNWEQLDLCTQFELLEGIVSESAENKSLEECISIVHEEEEGEILNIPLSFKERWLPVAITGRRESEEIAGEIYESSSWELLLIDLDGATDKMPLYKLDSYGIQSEEQLPLLYKDSLSKLNIDAF